MGHQDFQYSLLKVIFVPSTKRIIYDFAIVDATRELYIVVLKVSEVTGRAGNG